MHIKQFALDITLHLFLKIITLYLRAFFLSTINCNQLEQNLMPRKVETENSTCKLIVTLTFTNYCVSVPLWFICIENIIHSLLSRKTGLSEASASECFPRNNLQRLCSVLLLLMSKSRYKWFKMYIHVYSVEVPLSSYHSG